MIQKLSALIVIAFAVLSIVTGLIIREPCPVHERQCPLIQGDEMELTILPVPTDCTKYILCHYGTPYVRPCPEGLLYSQELKVCDFANRTKCVECEKEESTTSILNTTSTTAIPSTPTFIPISTTTTTTEIPSTPSISTTTAETISTTSIPS